MSRTETYAKWTVEEVEFLVENYDDLTAEAIAEALDRTPDSVWEKAGREGLRKHRKRHQRDPDGPWVCPECGKTKPKEEFGNSSSGRGSAYCKECGNRKQRERRRASKTSTALIQ